MFRPNWQDLDGSELERVHAELDRLGEEASRPKPKIAVAPLDEFYERCVVVQVGDNKNSDIYQRRFLLWDVDADTFIRLDWTNQPIYQFNQTLSESGRFRLNRRTIPNYARFFFHFVRGQLGSFLIVEEPKDMDEMWLPNATATQKAEVIEKVRPMVYRSIFERHFYRLDAVVVFKNALFRTDILIAPFAISHTFDEDDDGIPESFSVGQMKLANEELLLEDKPLKIDPPPPLPKN